MNPNQREDLLNDFRIVMAYISYKYKKILLLYEYADKALYNSLEYGTKEEILANAAKEHKYKQLKELYEAATNAASKISQKWDLFMLPQIDPYISSALFSLHSLSLILEIPELVAFLNKCPPPPKEIEYATLYTFTEEGIVDYLRQYINNIFLNDQKQSNFNRLFPN